MCGHLRVKQEAACGEHSHPLCRVIGRLPHKTAKRLTVTSDNNTDSDSFPHILTMCVKIRFRKYIIVKDTLNTEHHSGKMKRIPEV